MTGAARSEPGRPLTGEPWVRVMIADHDGLARRMLRGALQDADGVVVVGSAQDAREMLELVGYYRPGVLIIDVGLLAGEVELIRQVLAWSPGTRILTVAADDDQELVLAALRAGSVGHASKDLDPEVLARLVLLAAAGEAIVPRELMMPLLGVLREVPDAGWRPLHSCLTTREWEIVELLAEGATTEHIADRLVVSIATVYSHVKSVLRKLDVNSRREAVAAARQLRRKEALGRKIPIAA